MTERRASEIDQLADLAEAMLSVARRLTMAGSPDSSVIQLSPLEALVMRHIDRNPGTTPSRLAAHLALRSSNASAALRELEAKGLISRTVDPDDARGVRIEPTPAARENLERKRLEWASVLAPHVGAASGLAAAVALLNDIDQGLDQS